MGRIKYRPFVPYKDAFDEFTRLRKELNNLAEKDANQFSILFNKVKIGAANESTACMDILAYYYKSGVKNGDQVLVPENYPRYIEWEMLAAARGNEFAIEKLQFLIGYACDSIIECEDYDLIAYKNDIDDSNLLYILGKAIAKIYVRENKIYPVDLFALEDEEVCYKKEHSVVFRNKIDEIIQKTIDFLKS